MAIKYDDSPRDWLDTLDLKKTLAEAVTALGRPLDVLGFDNVLSSSAELHYQLRDVAGYVVAFQETDVAGNWPIDRIVRQLAAKPDMKPTELSSVLLREVQASILRNAEPGSEPATALSAVQLAAMKPLGQQLSEFVAVVQKDDRALKALRDARRRALSSRDGNLVDLADLLDQFIAAYTPDTTDDAKATGELPALENARALRAVLEPGKGPIIETNTVGAQLINRAHGMWVYFPSETVALPHLASEMDFAQTGWYDLLPRVVEGEPKFTAEEKTKPQAADINPFRDRGRIGDPRYFFNRVSELSQLTSLLKQARSVSLVGPYGSGKSSMLAHLQATAPVWFVGDPGHVVYLDCQGLTSPQDFYTELCQLLGKPGTTAREARAALQDESAVLLIDEFEALSGWPAAQSVELYGWLRSVLVGGRTTAVVATQRPLAEATHQQSMLGSPLANIFSVVTLSAFRIDETRALITERLAGTQVTFSESEIARLCQESQGLPRELLKQAAELYSEKIKAGEEPPEPKSAVWLYMATGDDSAQLDLLAHRDQVTWGANPNTNAGDIVLMYRTAPYSDIAYLFRAALDARPAPRTATWQWDYAIELADKVTLARPVTFKELQAQASLADWGLVKARMQGALRRTEDIRGEGYWEALRALLVTWNPSCIEPLLRWEEISTPGPVARAPNVAREISDVSLPAVFTNQHVINAFHDAAAELGLTDRWALLKKIQGLSLVELADDRQGLYAGPDLAQLPQLTEQERRLVHRKLIEAVQQTPPLSPAVTMGLQTQADGRIEVQIKTSLTGQSQAVVAPPFREPIQRQAVALALEAVSFDSAAWQAAPQVFQALKDLGLGSDSGFTGLREGIGTALFEAFFPPGELREALRANLNAASAETPARVELDFWDEDAGVCAYPWELLYDPDRGFVFANRRATLVRYVACPLSVPRLLTSGALNLLLVTARPISQPTDPIQLPLLVDAESKAIADGLAEPLASGTVHLEPLPLASPARSTWELLSDYLTTHTGAEAPHILHFDGHGGFGRRCAIAPAGCGLLNAASETVCRGCGRHLDGPPQGYLAFEARNKRPHWVSAHEMSSLLVGAGVRLAVLTASKSATVAGQSVFSGMGPALIQAGEPAVVAMQFSVTDKAAESFTRSFYLALAQYAPVTQAMSQARFALFADETAWYRPVLYLCSDEMNLDGKLFARMTNGKSAAEKPTAPVGPPPRDTEELLRRILSNLELTETAFAEQIKRRDALYHQIRYRLRISPGLESEKLFFEYHDQLTKSELVEFEQIRAFTETTLQTRNRDTLSVLEANPALLDVVPRLSDLRTHLLIWLNKYDGLFANTPEMCVLYVGVEDGMPFPRGIEQSIQDWLERAWTLSERLSPEAEAALIRAEAWSEATGAGEVCTEYVLAGLYEQPDGPARRLLTLFENDATIRPALTQLANTMTRTSLRLEEVQAAADRELAGLPLSKNLGLALDQAAHFADQAGESKVSPLRLLAGLQAATQSVAASWVAERLQIEPEVLARLLTEAPGNELPIDAIRKASRRPKASSRQEALARIELLQADLLTLQVDAIVHATSPDLDFSGSVGEQIAQKLGEDFLDRVRKMPKPKLGNAVITDAGSLPAHHIIHTPVRQADRLSTPESVTQGVLGALSTAAGLEDIQTVAFSAIGKTSGLDSAQVALPVLEAVVSYLQQNVRPARVVFALLTPDTLNIYQAALDDLQLEEAPTVPVTTWRLSCSGESLFDATVGQPLQLVVRLSPPERAQENDKSVPFAVPATTRHVTFYVEAPGFHLDSEDRQTVSLVQEPPTERTLTVTLRPLIDGDQRVTIMAYSGVRVEGLQPAELIIPIPVAAAAVLPPIPELIERGAIPEPQPDIMLYVALEGVPSDRHVQIYVTCPALGKDRKRLDPALPLTEKSAAEIRRAAIRAAADAGYASPPDAAAALRAFGAALFDLLLPHGHALRKLYFGELRRLFGASLLIVSDEDVVLPWEMACAYYVEEKRPGTQFDDFWGRKFVVTHWVGRKGRPLAGEAPLGQIDLTHYQQYGEAIPRRWQTVMGGAEVVSLETGAGHLALMRPGSPYYGLHILRFTDQRGHGRVTRAKEKGAATAVQDGEARQLLYDRRLDFTLRRPIVGLSLVNGSTPDVDAGLGSRDTRLERGWMLPMMHAGATAIVGPRWPTSSEADLTFYGAFYAALRTGMTVGWATWIAREQTRLMFPSRPDWLAYTCFGHPNCAPYLVRPSEGFVSFEEVDHEADAALIAGKTYNFLASYRTEAPEWFGGRLWVPQDLPQGEEVSAIVVPLTGQVSGPDLARLLPLQQTIAGYDFERVFALTMPDETTTEPVLIRFQRGGQELGTVVLNLDVVKGS
jgi:O-acetyl-ADP-ribose deacetylase (regulator of RNase III)